MMVERTPVSLALVAALAEVATNLLANPVLAGRAKGTQYSGATAWHRDSEGPVQSLGILCYLDPLTETTGALRVIPGSHRQRAAPSTDAADLSEVDPLAVHLNSSPGDIVVLDEHLLHASDGGSQRTQWRVDFLTDSGRDEELSRYFANQHVIGWDGGYDVDLFPSYGRAWQDLDDRWTRRLAHLGVFELAEAEERYVREKRLTPG